MEVILLERIERLGPMGQVVKVRPGFARNYLLPHKKALRATKANLELFEKQRAELEAKNAAQRAEAEAKGAKMDNIKLVIIRQASEMGQLFGSVTARDVAEAAKEAGQTIERGMVQIDTPIKELGLFPVKVKLHPEVMVKVTVNVARSADEAKIQAEKGAALKKAAAAEAVAAAEKASIEAIGTEGESSAPITSFDAPEAEAAEPTKKAKKPRAKKADKKED
ncbi:MAG: 50S ribosomal protein L9 [Alphaproteobacteria bacterium]|nr:50S ribosomal protein L9 [Alphaproteobacteria bacterium]